MKITKFIILFLSTLLIVFYIFINNSIGKPDSFLQELKLSLSKNTRETLKDTIFVFKRNKELKKELSEIKEKKTSKLIKIFSNPLIYDHLNDYLKTKSILDLKDIRNLMIKDYILDKSQISFNKIESLDWKFKGKKPKNRYEVFKVQYYDLKHFGILEKKNKLPSKNLFIYAQGHRGGTLYSDSNFLDIKEEFKNNDYDVLSLDMTGLGYNENKIINFPNYKKNANPSIHGTYSTFLDKNFPNKKPLSLMLSGNYFLIKKIIKQNNYKKIVMVGVSGGGWYTTLLSSLITEIDTSYSFSGTMPLFFMVFGKDMEDWELIDSSLYDKVDYNSLYILATLNREYKVTRKHYQVYNSHDPCCLKDPAATLLKNIYNNLKVKNFEVVVIDSYIHSIDSKFLFESHFNYQK